MLTDDESKPETDPIIGPLFLRAPFCTPHTFSGSSNASMPTCQYFKYHEHAPEPLLCWNLKTNLLKH